MSSILPKKNVRKQFDLGYRSSKFEFFSFIFWENCRYQRDISKSTDLYSYRQCTGKNFYLRQTLVLVQSKLSYYNDFQECKTLLKLLNRAILPRPQWCIYYFMGLDINELYFSNTIFRGWKPNFCHLIISETSTMFDFIFLSIFPLNV